MKKDEKTPAPKVNVHAGHRERLRAQIEKSGIAHLPDHVILEYLLFYVIPRRDTNELAHRLIDRFGSLSGVLDADIGELQKVEGVGLSTARFLKIFPMINERYALEKFNGHKSVSIEKIAKFLIDYYAAKTEEEVFVFFLDNSGGLIGKEAVYHGSINSTYLSPRALLDAICRAGAVSVILSHNHPAGDAKPSQEDISLTRRLMDAFIPFGISIKAHLVVAKDKYVDIIPEIYKIVGARPRYIVVKSPESTVPGAADAPLSDRISDGTGREFPPAPEQDSDGSDDGLSALYLKYGVEHE